MKLLWMNCVEWMRNYVLWMSMNWKLLRMNVLNGLEHMVHPYRSTSWKPQLQNSNKCTPPMTQFFQFTLHESSTLNKPCGIKSKVLFGNVLRNNLGTLGTSWEHWWEHIRNKGNQKNSTPFHPSSTIVLFKNKIVNLVVGSTMIWNGSYLDTLNYSLNINKTICIIFI